MGELAGRTETAPESWKSRPKTNGDRLRAMTDEELAEVLWDEELTEALWGNCPDFKTECSGMDCKACWYKWLQSEVEE